MASREVSNAFTTLLKKDSREDQYDRFEAEADFQRIVETLSLVERLYPDQVLMLCNRSHPKLQYVGANCQYIFGFDKDEIKALKVSDFFARIHPEDIDGLHQCFEFINSAEPYDPATHRFVLHYRFKGKKGSYLYLRDEKLAIKTEAEKYVYFAMFQNVSSREKFFHVKLDVLQYEKGEQVKIHTFNPRHGIRSITPRQIEIIKLIIKGFSTQEIADRLNLSINTIKNHKQVLFRRINVKTSLELVNFANRV